MSECRWDPRFREGVDTTDEHCAFELLESPSILAASGVGTSSGSGEIPPSAFDERAYVRNILKDGLSYVQGNEQTKGESWPNPFKQGIVAASDSHDGTMGWHPEDASYRGHLGIEDAIPVSSASNIQNSSGGNAVVWAEENSRDAIFEALKRKETYGTSGPRIRVRFFGGWEFAEDLCGGDLVAAGYAKGVPMGGDLPSAQSATKAPRFVAAAWMDDYLGTPLQRVQIIKGWVEKKADGSSKTFEKVYDVAGAANGASVDAETCEPQGKGHKFLCAVFEDPDFDPAVPAFYYARVLENPVCRYSTHYCRENFDVNPLATDCKNQLLRLQQERPLDYQSAQFCCSNETTSPIVQPTIQERPWTSPIWYTPAGLE